MKLGRMCFAATGLLAMILVPRFAAAAVNWTSGGACQKEYSNADYTLQQSLTGATMYTSPTTKKATLVCPVSGLPGEWNLITKVVAGLTDNSTGATLSCFAATSSHVGYLTSSTKFLCTTSNGCTGAPDETYRGYGFTAWDYPFGYAATFTMNLTLRCTFSALTGWPAGATIHGFSVTY